MWVKNRIYRGNCPGTFGGVSEIGKRIRAARGYAGMSQTELGNLLGISLDTVAETEAGRREARPGEITEIARVTGMPREFVAGAALEVLAVSDTVRGTYTGEELKDAGVNVEAILRYITTRVADPDDPTEPRDAVAEISMLIAIAADELQMWVGRAFDQ